MARLLLAPAAVTLPLATGPGTEKGLDQELRTALFGARDRIYAILDGGRIEGLPERLEALDVPRLCLFSGQMVEDAGEMAPWLVELTPENPLLRRMLCDMPDDVAAVHGLMRRGPGIFLRTALPIKELRAHLRRFMRVKDANDGPFFFRFWEPEAAAAYFKSIANRPETVTRWMCPRDGTAPLEAIAIPTWIGGPALVCVTAQDLPGAPEPARGAFILTREDVAALRDVQWRRDRWSLMERLRTTFPERVKGLGTEATPIVEGMIDRMVALGFWRRDMLFTFCAWALHFGADVLERDPEGKLQKILALPAPVEDRFALIAERMETLEKSYFALLA